MPGRRSLISDDSGATAVEYALILGAIFALIVSVTMLLGNKINGVLSNTAAGFPGS